MPTFGGQANRVTSSQIAGGGNVRKSDTSIGHIAADKSESANSAQFGLQNNNSDNGSVNEPLPTFGGGASNQPEEMKQSEKKKLQELAPKFTNLKDYAINEGQQSKKQREIMLIDEICQMIKINRPDTEIIKLVQTYQIEEARYINRQMD